MWQLETPEDTVLVISNGDMNSILCHFCEHMLLDGMMEGVPLSNFPFCCGLSPTLLPFPNHLFKSSSSGHSVPLDALARDITIRVAMETPCSTTRLTPFTEFFFFFTFTTFQSLSKEQFPDSEKQFQSTSHKKNSLRTITKYTMVLILERKILEPT